MITRNCMHRDPRQTGFVGKGSDHLQLIKFWLSQEGGLRRSENFWLRLTTASAQCLHLLCSEHFFIFTNGVSESLSLGFF